MKDCARARPGGDTSSYSFFGFADIFHARNDLQACSQATPMFFSEMSAAQLKSSGSTNKVSRMPYYQQGRSFW